MKSGLESGDLPLNHLVVAQLSKTKLCGMFARGCCNDPSCRFAHSTGELRVPPDLTKTAICRAFVRGDCQDAACKFAHGESELRVTQSVYKTQLCNFYARGHCRKGNNCRHAHGVRELRSFRPEVPSRGAHADKPKPLSPGRVDKGMGTPVAESSISTRGEYPGAVPATVGHSRSASDAAPYAPLAPPGLEGSTSQPFSASVKDGSPFSDSSGQSPPATPYQCGEVPMKVPLPIRPMTRTPPQPPLPRGGPGSGAAVDFDAPSSNMAPALPLAAWMPLLPNTPALPNQKPHSSWRAPEVPPQLPQLIAEHADPVGLATALAAAAMEHSAAASIASMKAWTWASAVVKASKMNYAGITESRFPIGDPDPTRRRA